MGPLQRLKQGLSEVAGLMLPLGLLIQSEHLTTFASKQICFKPVLVTFPTSASHVNDSRYLRVENPLPHGLSFQEKTKKLF